MDQSQCGARAASGLTPCLLLGAHARCHAETTTRAIEEAFKDFTNRDDIAVVLINQYVRGLAPRALERASVLVEGHPRN